MSKDNRGGHNKTFSPPTDAESGPVRCGEWVWYRKLHAKRWNRNLIHKYLTRHFQKQGVTNTPDALDIVSRLADAHYIRLIALRQIDLFDRGELETDFPRVGRRDAFSVLQSSAKDVSACMKLLGVYPLAKSSKRSSADSADDFQDQDFVVSD